MRFGIPVSGDDGRLVAVAAAPAPLPGLLAALYRGRAVDHPGMSWWHGDSVRVEGPVGAPIEADGEIVGLTPASYTVVPRAVRLVV
jgi:diacylglycerol kinase family enzyme